MKAQALALTVLVLVAAFACGGAPPQIVDYSPQRGARDVSTAEPIQITFDHDVDKASVESRLSLVPKAPGGTVQWLSGRRLTYEHRTLSPATTYEVVLDAGYRDPAGNVYSLRHHWSFVTEGPPSFALSTPSDGATDIDPADYLTVDFTRPMNETSLRGAITFSPTTVFNVRLDPTDSRRAIVAPDALLVPNTKYELMVSTSALDSDGNQLDRARVVNFTTGLVRPLHGWIAFVTEDATGASGGLWMVNTSDFPRQLLDVSSVLAYSWSPEGDRLIFASDSGAWSSFIPGVGIQPLGFTASWAAALASGLGYVYLDSSGALHRMVEDSSSSVIAVSVTEAAVSADGRRIAFAQPQQDGTTRIWGYDASLRSRYVLASDSTEVSALSWAPSGSRIAYLRRETTGLSLRVRSLTGAAATTTVATGDLGPPSWLRDSNHVLFAATVQSPAGPLRKAFLVNVATPPAALTVGLGLPADPAVSVSDPVPSPDGHQIAFLSGNQLWLMNADGTRPTPLTRYDVGGFPYSCRMPAWTRA